MMLSGAERRAGFADEVARALVHLDAVDPVMRRVIGEIGACGLEPFWERSPFEALVRSVAYQQLQGKAAAAILGRYLALFPPPFPTPADVPLVDDEAMRAAGLSRSKIAAIRDIAAKAIEGVVPDRAEAETIADDALIRRLVAIRGVGQWTVEMLLIFTLGRLDVLPVDDFGVRSGMRIAYGLEAMPVKREMLALAEPWRPYRSIASWYLWRVPAYSRAARPKPAATGSLGPRFKKPPPHSPHRSPAAIAATTPARKS